MYGLYFWFLVSRVLNQLFSCLGRPNSLLHIKASVSLCCSEGKNNILEQYVCKSQISWQAACVAMTAKRFLACWGPRELQLNFQFYLDWAVKGNRECHLHIYGKKCNLIMTPQKGKMYLQNIGPKNNPWGTPHGIPLALWEKPLWIKNTKVTPRCEEGGLKCENTLNVSRAKWLLCQDRGTRTDKITKVAFLDTRSFIRVVACCFRSFCRCTWALVVVPGSSARFQTTACQWTDSTHALSTSCSSCCRWVFSTGLVRKNWTPCMITPCMASNLNTGRISSFLSVATKWFILIQFHIEFYLLP